MYECSLVSTCCLQLVQHWGRPQLLLVYQTHSRHPNLWMLQPRQEQDHTSPHGWLVTASTKRMPRCPMVTRSPRPWTQQHHSADKGAHCPHPRVENTSSSHLSTLMNITCSAKQGAWFSQDTRQARPIHAIPSGDKTSPLGWKSLADCTVFLASIGPILSFRHKVSLCLFFFFPKKAFFTIWESTHSVTKSPSPSFDKD